MSANYECCELSDEISADRTRRGIAYTVEALFYEIIWDWDLP